MSGAVAGAGALAGFGFTASGPARKGSVGGAYRGPRQTRRALLTARRRRRRAAYAAWAGVVVFLLSLAVLVAVVS